MRLIIAVAIFAATAGCATTYAGGEPVYDDTVYAE